eukprot:scaffold49071_cov59-Phaeocystis_antarctica.AAC.6
MTAAASAMSMKRLPAGVGSSRCETSEICSSMCAAPGVACARDVELDRRGALALCTSRADWASCVSKEAQPMA